MIGAKFTTEITSKRMVWYDEASELEDNVTFKGHIQQMDSEVAIGLALSALKAYTIWCSINTDVEEDDVLEINSEKYIVKGVKRFNLGLNKHTQVFVEKEESYG